MSARNIDVIHRSRKKESVYNLCEKPKRTIVKKKRYKSKHSPKTVPTSTTFGLLNTSKPMGFNVKGETIPHIDSLGSKHAAIKSSNFGKKVKHTITPQNYRKKFTGTAVLPKPSKFKRNLVKDVKGAVPKRHEKPIMGLKTKSNFITTNIINNITLLPPEKEKERKYVEKRDYGKVPNYLKKHKKKLRSEKLKIKKAKDELACVDNTGMILLPEEEREEILKKLQSKKEELLKRYQSYGFLIPTKTKGKGNITLDNTYHLVRKKEETERELDEIEENINKFSKKNVFVFAD